ncbi:MAG: YvcK family protein [Chloroflexi bacterium]|nr:YvcK family protein [Chloroflexota bacterium]
MTRLNPPNPLARFVNRSTLKWLYFGLGVKRWLVLLFLGVTILGLGFAVLLVNIYRESPLPDIFYYLTLQFIPRLERGIFMGAIGVGLIAVAVVKLSESLLSAFVADDINVVEVLYRKRARRRGPKIVAIGGGTGLSTLLRGLKEHTDRLTAIVTVADDGGSSGTLRRQLGVLPPGDIRQCIAALADSEPLVTQLFQYRFGEGTGLDGHSFGNLFIAAMAGVTGNFERAILESSRVLAVRGQILPSTLENMTLCADTRDPAPAGSGLARVAGESEISHRGRPIERVYLEPEHVPAYPGVVRAILDADLIVAGPGSLYTSVLPNLLVDQVRSALGASNALKVYVCNVATQPGETDHFSVEDHLDALVEHVGSGIFTRVFANNNFAVSFPEHSNSQMVRTRDDGKSDMIIVGDLVDEAQPWRHDPVKLASAILKCYQSSKQS